MALNHRLALVTTSYTEISNLSLSDQVGASPFFNIFTIVYLGSFKPLEVNQFFDHYLAGTKIHFSSEERDFIISIAGFHPYYLTVASRLLFDAHLNLPLASQKPLADVKRRFTVEVKGALRDTWNHTNDDEKIALTMLALLTLSGGNSRKVDPHPPSPVNSIGFNGV